jgi:CheY-like chemotaxis protein
MSLSVNPPPCFLLVEDSEDDAFFLERSLDRTEIAYRLERVKNGKEAVDYLQQFAEGDDLAEAKPRIIFLDLKMPGVNGFEVLEWIRTHGLHPSLDIIILSGSDQDGDIQKALRMGASAYLVKPPSVDDLRECLVPRLARWGGGPSMGGIAREDA